MDPFVALQISKAASGSDEALRMLRRAYDAQVSVVRRAFELYPPPSKDEVSSVTERAFWTAVKTYDAKRGSGFERWITVVLRSKLISARAYAEKRRRRLPTVSELSEWIEDPHDDIAVRLEEIAQEQLLDQRLRYREEQLANALEAIGRVREHKATKEDLDSLTLAMEYVDGG